MTSARRGRGGGVAVARRSRRVVIAADAAFSAVSLQPLRQRGLHAGPALRGRDRSGNCQTETRRVRRARVGGPRAGARRAAAAHRGRWPSRRRPAIGQAAPRDSGSRRRGDGHRRTRTMSPARSCSAVMTMSESPLPCVPEVRVTRHAAPLIGVFGHHPRRGVDSAWRRHNRPSGQVVGTRKSIAKCYGALRLDVVLHVRRDALRPLGDDDDLLHRIGLGDEPE